MTESSPEIARTVPPLTGASSIAMPRSRRRRAKRRAANGSIVLMHRTMCPAWAEVMMPRSPVMTSSAWSVVSTIEIVRSVRAATAAGDCFHQRFELHRVDVVDDQRKSVLHQIERHRPTHGAEADKPHFAGHAVYSVISIG